MSQVLELRHREPQESTPATEPYLVFTNPGTLKMNLVKLLGVSVKESNDPIGFFGTGLKYAMATALRLGGCMTILTGGERYEISGKKITLRDKEFTQIMLNDEALGFTTELGKQWEAWMVVRELYSNALDESGETSVSEADLSSLRLDGRTVVALRGQCFLDVWNNRNSYFLALNDERPCQHSPYTDVYDLHGLHNHAVFYRGIRIHDTVSPTLYKYNINEAVTLTEDRTLKYGWQFHEALEKTIITSDDPEFIERILTCGETFYEGKLQFTESYSSVALSAAFKNVCADLAVRMPQNVCRAAIRFYHARTQTKQPLAPASMTSVQRKQMEKAIALVKRIGFADELDQYPIDVVQWLGENVLGKALNGRIYIAKDCFDKGTKYLASTLLEEFVHCRYGFTDESRALQTWLFDRIITMGEEHVTGEPL